MEPPPSTAGMRWGQLGRGGICSSRDPLGTWLVLLGWGFGSTRRGDGSGWEGAVPAGKGARTGRDGAGPARKGPGLVGMGLGWVRMGLGSGWEGRGGMELGVCGEGALVWLGGLVQRDQVVVAGTGLGPGWSRGGERSLRPCPGLRQVLGVRVMAGSLWVGGCWGQGHSGWKDLGTPVGLPGRRPALPLAAWVAGASRNATRSCSINNGDFPYLLIFAGGLEPRKRLASPARRSRL